MRKTPYSIINFPILKGEMDRILTKIHFEPNTGCWLWDGSVTHNGYGIFSRQFGDKTSSTVIHRMTYRWYKGEIPEDLELDHLCQVRCCANPEHMEPVTNKENFDRSMKRGKIVQAWLKCEKGHHLTEGNICYYTIKNSGKIKKRCRECQKVRWKKNHKRLRDITALKRLERKLKLTAIAA